MHIPHSIGTERQTGKPGKPPAALLLFLAITTASVLGAILWRLMRWSPGNIGHVAGAAMILTGTMAAAQPLARAAGWRRTALAAVGACVIGGASEIVWLLGGFTGRYEYLDQWKPAITLPDGLTFPVFLPVMWFVILAACYAYARQRVAGVWAILVGALVAVGADLFGEAVLTRSMGFWVWLEPTPILGAPTWNWLGWLIISLIGCSWLAVTTRGRKPTGPEPVWIIAGAMAGVALIGVSHDEPRGLWALAPMAVVLAWRAPRVNGLAADDVSPPGI